MAGVGDAGSVASAADNNVSDLSRTGLLDTIGTDSVSQAHADAVGDRNRNPSPVLWSDVAAASAFRPADMPPPLGNVVRAEARSSPAVSGRERSSSPAVQVESFLPSFLDWSRHVLVVCSREVQPIYPLDVVNAITRIIPRGHVISLGNHRNPWTFLVQLDSPAVRARLVAAAKVSVKNVVADVFPATPGQVTLTLNRLPQCVPDNYVVESLSPWCTVLRQLRLRYAEPDLVDIISTRRQVVVTLKPGTELASLPAVIQVAGFEVPIYVRGRPQLCHRCSRPGHVRRSCPFVLCRQCGQFAVPDHGCSASRVATVNTAQGHPESASSSCEVSPTNDLLQSGADGSGLPAVFDTVRVDGPSVTPASPVAGEQPPFPDNTLPSCVEPRGAVPVLPSQANGLSHEPSVAVEPVLTDPVLPLTGKKEKPRSFEDRVLTRAQRRKARRQSFDEESDSAPSEAISVGSARASTVLSLSPLFMEFADVNPFSVLETAAVGDPPPVSVGDVDVPPS